MNIHPYLLILIAAASNATFNIILKVGLSKMPKTESFLELAINLIKSSFLWIGAGLFVVALFCYTSALQRVNLSIAYPLLVSMVSLTIITISMLFLHEIMTLPKVVGIAFLLSGVWLLVR